MNTELDILKLQNQKNEIELLLKDQSLTFNRKFEKNLEQQFWIAHDYQLIQTLQKIYLPTVYIFFVFMCVSLIVNYHSADEIYRYHDFSRNLISFSATWVGIFTLFTFIKIEKWRTWYTPIVSVVTCIALTINLCVQLTMLSLPVIWRGTIVMALVIVFLYLGTGFRPRVTLYVNIVAGVLTCIYIKTVAVTVPNWVIMNTILLPNLVGLALSAIGISTERVNFLQSKIIDYDKQIYALLNKKSMSLSQQDPLTLLGNRRGFEEKLKQTIELTQASKRPFALLFLDVDFFKNYNDYYGHDCGDKALVQIANVLKEFVGSGDLAIRFGGEEFVMILLNHGVSQAEQVSETILNEIHHLKIEHNRSSISPYVTISIGYTVFDGSQNLKFEHLLKCADEALYQAKQSGRNRKQFLSPYQ